MANDIHRSQPDKLPSFDYEYVPASYGYESQSALPSHGRSRASSNAPSEPFSQPSHQPLKNAIGHAFENSHAASVVDPGLIAQITAEVKKSVLDELKSGMTGVTQPKHDPSVPQFVPPSPVSATSSVLPRDLYTPPSPNNADLPNTAPAATEPSGQSPPLDGNSDTPTPRNEKSVPPAYPQERLSTRPAPSVRMATDDYTPIEKMWQTLFDREGKPTQRLGQFLRGLALHLVEDYEPKKNLVITPAKMLKFYNEVRLQDESYPWQTIFGKLSYSSLGKIYRDMRCQHHLVQEHPAEQPYIPALTPEGFQEWMTAMIQAYPDVESERLAKAILSMPISNADDRKERFPKELPRRMLPPNENLQAQQRCAAALSSEGVGPLRRAPTFPPPPPKTHTSASVPNLERERSPYVSSPDAQVFDSEDELEPSASVPIERQRKPYAATPGGGKVYDEAPSRSVPPDASINGQRRRTTSTANQSQWPPPSSQPHDTYSQPPHLHRTGSQAQSRRPRSPSFTNYGTKSDSSVRDVPSSFYTSNIHDDEEARRYYQDADARKTDRHRRSTAGTDGTYDDDDYRGRTNSNAYDSRGYEPRRYG